MLDLTLRLDTKLNNKERPTSGRHPQRGRRSGKRKELMSVPQASIEAQVRLKTLLSSGTYIVFDIETTGGNPEKNGITEIFAIRYSQGEVLGTYYSMVNPGIPIPPIVRRMTGINNQMVRNEPRIDAVMPDFVKFIGDDVLVSHNTIGDMKFVRHFAKQTVGIDMENFYLCTHLLVEKLAPETPDKSLRGLAEYFKLASGELHRAEADAYVTLALFKVLLGRLNERAVKRIDEAVRLQGDLESGMRLGWGIPEKSLEQVPAAPGVFFLNDHEGRPLFFASSLNLERDIAKLRVFHQLPRQLLRLVLKSADITTQRTPNIYAAVLAESAELAKGSPAFHPSDLHQRSVQSLFIAHDGDGLRVGLGAVEAGTIYAFGPLRDRRIAGEFLDLIAALAEAKVGRSGVRLPMHFAGPLLDLLHGRLEATLLELMRQRRSLRLWFKPSARQELGSKINLLQGLSSIRVPSRLHSLLEETGLIIVPAPHGAWHAHHIVNSRPCGITTLNGDIERELWHNGQAEVLAAQLEQELSQQAQPEPLTQHQADIANATLWFLHNGRFDGRFISLKQLRLHEPETRPKPQLAPV